MPMYPFHCDECGTTVEIRESIHKPTPEPRHCGRPMEYIYTPCGQVQPERLYGKGKWTGLYDYDYGKKATWDLTPKGKLAMLQRQGNAGRDPFTASGISDE